MAEATAKERDKANKDLMFNKVEKAKETNVPGRSRCLYNGRTHTILVRVPK